jgi:hypothetical protein
MDSNMTKPRYLTKSRFKLGVECPTKLFYVGKSEEYQDAMAGNDFLAMLAEGGYQVGALAKLRYPGGIEIEGLDHALTIARTRELLDRENVVLFEPAIQVGDFFIRIDVLVKTGNRFELIEVKAKSYDSLKPEMEGKRGGINTGMLPYIQDAAFQTWVLRQEFPDAEITTALMMPDKSKLAPVDGINQMFKFIGRSAVEVRSPQGLDMKALAETLLAKVCVDSYVSQILSQPLEYPGGPSSLGAAAATWAAAYRNDHKIAPRIGAHCGGCQYKAQPGDALKSGFHECWKAANNWKDQDFFGGTVLDLWNFRGKQKMIDQGTFKISQVQREDIGDFADEPEITGLSRKQRQWLQVNGIPNDYDHGGYYFDSTLASVEMSGWKFPYHFIDFETSSVALPFYKGMRPYEPVAFQFSHHIMEADGSVRHADEFLCAEPGEFPNYQFARALKAALDQDDGTVFMWSHHENTILSKIVTQLAEDPNRPEDAEDLSNFIMRLIKGGDRAMVDLCTMAEKAFFHPDTKGGNSIKKVLPAVLKVSTVLRETYSQPVYGAPGGIPSLNFASPQGFTWIDVTTTGSVADPYACLKEYAEDLLPEDAEDNSSIIAEGGAAATAYARLQFEDMDNETRDRIKAALLRYCELDTLAMVMVVQAWREDGKRYLKRGLNIRHT